MSSTADSVSAICAKNLGDGNNNKYNIFNNNKKCRTCLSTNRDTVPLDATLPDLIKKSTYMECLRKCTGLKVPVEMGNYFYPKQICLRCCKALEVATHFVDMAKESERKLSEEADAVNARQANVLSEVAIKRPAEEFRSEQFSQQFTEFVANYEPVIEENVLYMRGTKVPRLDLPASTIEDVTNDVILYDVVYENSMDEDDENDAFNTKNNETFSEVNVVDEFTTNNITNQNNSNNNVNENFNENIIFHGNSNEEKSLVVPTCNGDIIQEAYNLAVNETCSTNYINTDNNNMLCKDNELLKCMENCTLNGAIPNNSTSISQMPMIDPTSISETLVTDVTNKSQSPITDAINLPTLTVVPIQSISNDTTTFVKNVPCAYKCRSCTNLIYQSKDLMCQHLLEHHKIEQNFEIFYAEIHECTECQRCFKDQKSLRTHYTRLHNKSTQSAKRDQVFVCDSCERSFNLNSSLHSHLRYCKAKDPVQCAFCSRKFKTSRRYEVHLQNEHSVNTVHECELCKNIFKTADALALHRKRHTERNFQCEKCPLNYINATELKVHYERAHVHHQEVNCQTCGQEFQNRSLLREHEQRSHQKKSWKCETCDFETTIRTRFRQHQYEHTGFPYQCNVCNEEFGDRSKMRQHSKKMHNIELSDEALADMFRDRLGYTSRQDAFSKAPTTLELPNFSDDYNDYLTEIGLNYDELTDDLFLSNGLNDFLNFTP